MNLICGINPVLEALASGTRHFDRVLVVKGLRNRRLAEAMRRATRLGVPLRFEMRETLDRLAGGVPHQGIIAVVSEKPVLSLEALLDAAREPALVVVLDGVEDPRNLGAILRTAEAAGADGVVLPERHSAGLSETVARASAGALEHVRVARVGNLAQALEALKERGIWVVGFDAAGTERWDAVDLQKPVALVLGGEGRGIRRLVRERCDHLVSIPHFGHVSSLNVSVAAGVALYEAVRQRRAVPSLVRPIPARPAGSLQVIGPGADDDEVDPGARPGWPEQGDGTGGDHEADVREADPAASVTHLDLHEDVAWGQGPTVLKPVGFARRVQDGRRGRGRPRPPRRDAPSGAAPAEERGRDERPRDERADDGAQDRGDRRRKGRRRRRRGGGAPHGAPGAGGGGAPHSQGGDGDAPAGPPSPRPEGERSPGGGRRRRRRRR
jgi:23S rRNA (guanosine2251-2'-O)-methyltransferase